MVFFEKRKVKLNNAGMTLVELLIAITILGIIVGPMLYAFVYSTSMNTKSRRNLNANTVASDVAEGLKANDIKTIAGQFDYYDDAEFNIINSDLIKGAKKAGELSFDGTAFADIATKSSSRSTFTDPVTGNTSIIYDHVYKADGTKQNDGIYYLYIDDVEPKFEKYDALIKLDARPYQSGSTKYAGPTNKNYRFNEFKMPTFSSVGGKSYIQKDDDSMQIDPTGTLYRHAVALMPTLVPTEDMLYRKITMDIDKDASSNIKVKVIYTYTLKGSSVTTPASITNEYTIYDSTVASDPLKKVYLFFKPMYNSRGGDMHDEIEINNMQNLDVDVYLVKQELYSVANLLTAETLYRTNITVNEGTTMTDASTNLFTNVDYNLYHLYDETIPADISQGIYKYNTITNQTVAKKALNINGLSSAKAEDRFFDMTITIFKSDAITDAGYDFDDDKKLYELTGSTLK